MTKTTKKTIVSEGKELDLISNKEINYHNVKIVSDSSSNMELSKVISDNVVVTNATISNITASNITVTRMYFDTEDIVNSGEVGEVTWNNTDKCLDVQLSNDVTLQVGQEIHLRVLNKTGSDISNGKLLYVNGAQGNRPTVDLADNTNYQNASRIIAMATENIDNNEYGFGTTFGLVRGLNTVGLTESTIMYLGTSGAMTSIKPTPPTAVVKVGTIVKEHVSDGQIALCINHKRQEFGCVNDGNYSYFEEDGTLVNIGEATTWDDLPPNPIIRSRIPAANNPTLATFVGNIQQYTFDINDYVGDNLEILHEWKEETDLNPHIHWVTNGTTTSDTAVAWEMELTMANASSTPTTSIQTFATTSIISVSTVIPANTADRSHFISSFPTLTMTGRKIGAVIAYNIKRITADGTAPDDNPFGLQVSCHRQKNTQGSRQMYIK